MKKKKKLNQSKKRYRRFKSLKQFLKFFTESKHLSL